MFKGFTENSIGNDDAGILSFPHPTPFTALFSVFTFTSQPLAITT